MLNLGQLKQPGEHPFVFSGEMGEIEAIVTIPPVSDYRYVALLGHPHSLQGGSMNNKVVTTLARLFKELGIPSIRFNFRGVGQTVGVYDAGVGESLDMLVLAEQCQREFPQASLVFGGFSFGSYVAYRAAAHCPHALLLSIAPPVHHYDYTEFLPVPKPWVIVQGESDEVVPALEVRAFVSQSVSPIELLEFADTGHFFHGKLIELKLSLLQLLPSKDLLCL